MEEQQGIIDVQEISKNCKDTLAGLAQKVRQCQSDQQRYAALVKGLQKQIQSNESRILKLRAQSNRLQELNSALTKGLAHKTNEKMLFKRQIQRLKLQVLDLGGNRQRILRSNEEVEQLILEERAVISRLKLNKSNLSRSRYSSAKELTEARRSLHRRRQQQDRLSYKVEQQARQNHSVKINLRRREVRHLLS